MLFICVDARRGFEPRLLGSEPSVLPLDERAINLVETAGIEPEPARSGGLRPSSICPQIWCPWGDSNSQHLAPQASDSTDWPTRTFY